MKSSKRIGQQISGFSLRAASHPESSDSKSRRIPSFAVPAGRKAGKAEAGKREIARGKRIHRRIPALESGSNPSAGISGKGGIQCLTRSHAGREDFKRLNASGDRRRMVKPKENRRLLIREWRDRSMDFRDSNERRD
jgi:hypothetical protein